MNAEKQLEALRDALQIIADSSVQHYAMSVYPGENKMVPVHNSNTGQHWISAEHYAAVQAIAVAALNRAFASYLLGESVGPSQETQTAYSART